MGNGKRRRKARSPVTTPIRAAAEGTDEESQRSASFVLKQLTPEERLICLWKRLGYSSREIARSQGRSKGAIDELLHAAFAKIRR